MNAIVAIGGTSHLANNLNEYIELAKAVAGSGLFGSYQQCLVKILAGRELGFSAVASLTDVHIIKGKISVGAHLRAASIRASGRYDFRVLEHTDAVCAIEFRRKDGDRWDVLGVERITLKEAMEKGWTRSQKDEDKGPWLKTPKNMLFARAMTNGFKFHCPDLSAGISTYDPDELDPAGEVVDAEYTVQEQPKPNGTASQDDSLKGMLERTQALTETLKRERATPPVETLSPEQQDALALVFRDRKRTPQDMETLLASRGVHALQQLPRDLYDWAHAILADGQIDQEQSDRIAALVGERGFGWQDVNKRLQKKFGVDRLKLLTKPQADEIEKALQPKEVPA